ncbi:ferritin-like domain-containing protein [Inhella gelatinilytica]|uniref:Ferritin-like domain-containing protein n=1 Tax=Inhella gelatinilytica TaxID=2795030 RepID=A0A931IU98_9BURK|nr:ferritin-like domain-containing protein [Inhella gelatinilytica]MBH9552892.1 ferritin-like domain-containing protein [Inhella gelatinilytica]
MIVELRQRALDLLCEPDPVTKAQAVQDLWAAYRAGQLTLDAERSLVPTHAIPGRPPAPRLVAHVAIRSRSPHLAAGRAVLLHAIAHIEFNAINLALDAVQRFSGLPLAFYSDWLQVAAEEGQHFQLLREHLQTLDCDYGALEAHDGLWTMCERTAHDFRARMALVPRTLEARGLDATPPLQRKFAAAGDARAVEILDLILRDEIGHVAIGNRWYHWACERDGVDPETDFPALCARYQAPRPRKPLNLGARALAGFTADELQRLEAQAQ